MVHDPLRTETKFNQPKLNLDSTSIREALSWSLRILPRVLVINLANLHRMSDAHFHGLQRNDRSAPEMIPTSSPWTAALSHLPRFFFSSIIVSVVIRSI